MNSIEIHWMTLIVSIGLLVLLLGLAVKEKYNNKRK